MEKVRKPRVKCICGLEIAKSALKHHLLKSIYHWGGQMFGTNMSEEEAVLLVLGINRLAINRVNTKGAPQEKAA